MYAVVPINIYNNYTLDNIIDTNNWKCLIFLVHKSSTINYIYKVVTEIFIFFLSLTKFNKHMVFYVYVYAMALHNSSSYLPIYFGRETG